MRASTVATSMSGRSAPLSRSISRVGPDEVPIGALVTRAVRPPGRTWLSCSPPVRPPSIATEMSSAPRREMPPLIDGEYQ